MKLLTQYVNKASAVAVYSLLEINRPDLAWFLFAYSSNHEDEDIVHVDVYYGSSIIRPYTKHAPKDPFKTFQDMPTEDKALLERAIKLGNMSVGEKKLICRGCFRTLYGYDVEFTKERETSLYETG